MFDYQVHHRLSYMIIKSYYGDKKAKRSKVPYMNHINEGLIILQKINASWTAVDAYCLHPILQDDGEIEKNIELLKHIHIKTIVTTMEYRNVANRGLHCYQVDDPANIYILGLYKMFMIC